MFIFFIFLILFGIDYSNALINIYKSNNTNITPIMDVITNNGYPVEEHFVKTSDDYILRFHRIPHGKTNKNNSRHSKPILLMHGLFCTSAVWVISSPEKGFGYILADAGYDVWLGNSRGNLYSRNHTTLNPNSSSLFWSFSFHEMGMFDMPAMIDYILAQTNQEKLYMIGHSQGNTMFYVMASKLPEYNAKIAAHFSLAPVTYLKNTRSLTIQFLSQWSRPLGALLALIGVDEFIPTSEFFQLIGDDVCADGNPTEPLCENVLYLICGFSPDEQNTTLIPLIFDYSPGDGSTKQLLHLGQQVKSWHFQEYDNHFYGNLENYGRLTPPKYNLSAVIAPVYLFYSTSDRVASDVDAKKLGEKLPNLKDMRLVTNGGFGHLDYMYGIHADEFVYHPIVEIINSLE